MHRLLIGSAAMAAALTATPAVAQIYVGVGQSPYSYSYSPYSYGNSPYGYSGYSQPYGNSLYQNGYSSPYGNSPYPNGYSPYSNSYNPYGYGDSNRQYSYGYAPSYDYGNSAYGYRSSSRCIQWHHRNGIRYYTRVC